MSEILTPMDDGTLLEEMKKAVKQSAFAFSSIDEANLSVPFLIFFFGCPCQKS